MSDHDDHDVADWCDHALYLPPWRDLLPDGTLGAEHGPMTLGEYERQQEAHGQSFNAPFCGGCWDEEAEAAMPYSTRTLTRAANAKAERYDAAMIVEYMRVNSSRVPDREQEVFVLFYEDRRSMANCARAMGLGGRDSAYRVLKSLRARVRAWNTRRAA